MTKYLIIQRKRDIIPYLNGRTAEQVGKLFKPTLSAETIKQYIMELRKAGYDIPHRKSGRRSIPLD